MHCKSGPLKLIGQFSHDDIGERLVLSLSSVIGQFRSMDCSRLGARVLLVKFSWGVRSLFFDVVYVVDKSFVRRW